MLLKVDKDARAFLSTLRAKSRAAFLFAGNASHKIDRLPSMPILAQGKQYFLALHVARLTPPGWANALLAHETCRRRPRLAFFIKCILRMAVLTKMMMPLSLVTSDLHTRHLIISSIFYVASILASTAVSLSYDRQFQTSQ